MEALATGRSVKSEIYPIKSNPWSRMRTQVLIIDERIGYVLEGISAI